MSWAILGFESAASNHVRFSASMRAILMAYVNVFVEPAAASGLATIS